LIHPLGAVMICLYPLFSGDQMELVCFLWIIRV